MYICNTYNFGDRLRFGMTCELPQDSKDYFGTWLWGSFCYWIFGRCVGDMQYGVPLCDVQHLLEKYILKKPSFHCNEKIFHADAQQILRIMDEDMENEAGDIIKENCFGFVGTFDFWRNFWVSLELDIMNEYVILYFEHDTQARLIIGKLSENKEDWVFQSEHELNAGELQAVVQETFDWLQERYEKETETPSTT